MRSHWRCAALAGVLAMGACVRGEGLTLPKDASRIPEDQVVTLLRESSSGVTQRTRRAIQTADEWAQFWNQVYSTRSPVPAVPAIDFGQNTVIVAAMGQRSSGGYGIDFLDMGRVGEDYHVIVRETSPGRTCMTTAALSQPVVATRVPRTTGRVSFIERSEQQRC
jgi:hypothetical protein